MKIICVEFHHYILIVIMSCLGRAGKMAPKRSCSKDPHLVQIAVKCLQVPRLKQGSAL